MLVLTRRIGQRIKVGDGITVTYLGRDRHGRARLGIEAPGDVKISRDDDGKPYDGLREERGPDE